MVMWNKMHMHHLCKQHVGKYVAVQTVNQEQIHGFVEDVDDDHVYMVVPDNNYPTGPSNPMHPMTSPHGNMTDDSTKPYPHNRQYYGYYGGYPGWGYGPAPYSGFRRLVLPLTALVALSTLPYF
ncbi:hypothetical protein SAMN05192532_10121 [Alteribacillus iranensis]|uniref:Uncharacterized protein n=2 Tax=Alteribacillus iranensis TaxID=930128 RepID=A0A1I1Z4Z3_9BACI|nr:hypothetical protein SAMN05192532_10121 [Alteribacillus iranensis]